MHHDVIHIMSDKQREESATKIGKLCVEYQIEAIAVGNGTASRETESLVRSMKLDIPVVVVNESGASVYSASKEARDEFPGPGPHGARGGLHRPPANGPPGRAGQDRPQINRGGAVSA